MCSSVVHDPGRNMGLPRLVAVAGIIIAVAAATESAEEASAFTSAMQSRASTRIADGHMGGLGQQTQTGLLETALQSKSASCFRGLCGPAKDSNAEEGPAPGHAPKAIPAEYEPASAIDPNDVHAPGQPLGELLRDAAIRDSDDVDILMPVLPTPLFEGSDSQRSLMESTCVDSNSPSASEPHNRAKIKAVLFDNEWANCKDQNTQIRFVKCPGTRVKCKIVCKDRDDVDRPLFRAIPLEPPYASTKLKISPESVEIIRRTSLADIIQSKVYYDPAAGIDEEMAQSFDATDYPNLRAVFLDWDGTLSKFEGIYGGGTTMDDLYRRSVRSRRRTAKPVDPPTKEEFVMALAEFYFEGRERMEMLRSFLSSLVERNVKIYILTRNRSNDDVFSHLASTILPDSAAGLFDIVGEPPEHAARQHQNLSPKKSSSKKPTVTIYDRKYIIHTDKKMLTISSLLRDWELREHPGSKSSGDNSDDDNSSSDEEPLLKKGKLSKSWP